VQLLADAVNLLYLSVPVSFGRTSGGLFFIRGINRNLNFTLPAAADQWLRNQKSCEVQRKVEVEREGGGV
jgi:hypothetical protein